MYFNNNTGALPAGTLQLPAAMSSTLQQVSAGGVNSSVYLSQNQVQINGTYTAGGNNDYLINLSGTITGRNTTSDNVYGIYSDPTIVAGANSQTLYGWRHNVTFNDNSKTGLTKYAWAVAVGGTDLVNITYDGKVGIGTTTAASNPLYVYSNGTGSSSGIKIENASSGNYANIMLKNNSSQSAQITYNGTAYSNAPFVTDGLQFYVPGTGGIGNYVETITATSGTKTAWKLNSFVTTSSGNVTFSPIQINYTINNTGTVSGSVINGVHIISSETSLTGTTHYLINAYAGASGTSQKFYVKNDGLLFFAGGVTAANLPVGNGGLSAGQWYVDTAANILSNGDKIVAVKQ